MEAISQKNRTERQKENERHKIREIEAQPRGSLTIQPSMSPKVKALDRKHPWGDHFSPAPVAREGCGPDAPDWQGKTSTDATPRSRHGSATGPLPSELGFQGPCSPPGSHHFVRRLKHVLFYPVRYRNFRKLAGGRLRESRLPGIPADTTGLSHVHHLTAPQCPGTRLPSTQRPL